MRIAALLLTCGLLTSGALGPAPADAAAGPPDRPVLHRVVLDGAVKHGITILSAEVDGSDRREVYQRARGYVVDLSLNHRGSEVAFTPAVPRDVRSPLIVAAASSVPWAGRPTTDAWSSRGS